MKYGSDIRNIIFSFHMPLFFLLSGYTYKMANTATDLYSHIRKGCRHLLLPCIIVSIIGIFASFILGDGNGIQQLWETVKRTGDALWWASGVKVHSHPGAGAIWFLFSLFWAKTIIDGLNLMFPGKHMGYILTFVGLMGIDPAPLSLWLKVSVMPPTSQPLRLPFASILAETAPSHSTKMMEKPTTASAANAPSSSSRGVSPSSSSPSPSVKDSIRECPKTGRS